MKNKLKISEILTNHFTAVLNDGERSSIIEGIKREEIIENACKALNIQNEGCEIEFDYWIS